MRDPSLSSFLFPASGWSARHLLRPAVILLVILLSGCGGGGSGAPVAETGGSGAGAETDGNGAGAETGGDGAGTEAVGVPLSIVMVPPNYSTTEAAWQLTLTKAREAAPDHLSFGYLTWSEAEPAMGSYRWSDFTHLLAAGGSESLIIDVATPIGIDGSLDLPGDLTFAGFQDPVLREHYLAMIESAIDLAADRISHVVLHAEGVAEYVAGDNARLDAFAELLAHTIRELRSRHPGLRFGVYHRYENDTGDIFEALNRASDFVAVAMILNPPADTPASIEAQIARYVDAAAGKPLAIVECGYPSTPFLSSSEEDQAAFIRHMFAAMEQHAPALEFVAWYTIFDEPRAVYERIGDELYGTAESDVKRSFVSWMTSLGLHDETGVDAKEGWPELLRLAASRPVAPQDG